MFRHLINLLLFVLPPSRLFTFRRVLLKLAGIELAEKVCVCGLSWIFGPGRLAVGESSWLSPGFKIYTHKDAPIVIGSHCDIGHNVTIITGSHQFGDRHRRAGPGYASPIHIGDGTWIGARTTILAGVVIGSGCMIAAGSLVTENIPDNSFAAGVPAKIKRSFEN